jgi:hypothetical protein
VVVVFVVRCSSSPGNMMKRPHRGGLDDWMHRAGDCVDVAADVDLNRSAARCEQEKWAANRELYGWDMSCTALGWCCMSLGMGAHAHAGRRQVRTRYTI